MLKNKNTAESILNQLSGPIRFRITNAYMFVAVLTKNWETLCSLIAALLHMKRSQIEDVQIQNPIVLGQILEEKDCVLDLLVLLNGKIRIHLELQLRNEHNWDDRSIYYLGQKLCDLQAGRKYKELNPLIQIGILDFNYPADNREFYQQYALMNIKTHRIYSDKLRLNVLSLIQIENATEEDRESGLYEWAKVFKATTWEELKALAKNSKTIEDTMVTMAQLSEEEKIRQQCERWEKYEMDRIDSLDFAEERGRKAGLAEGFASGTKLHLVRQVCAKLAKGKTPETIADELEEDFETVSCICEAAKPFAPEYDAESVYQALAEHNI